MKKIFKSYFPITRSFIFLIILLAVMSIAIYALLDHIKSVFFHHADAQNQSVVNLAANIVDERINAKLIQLQALAYTPSSQKAMFNRDNLRKKLEQLQPAAYKFGYHFIQLTDAEGNSVSSTGRKVNIESAGHFYKGLRGFSAISQIISDDIRFSDQSSKNGIVLFSVPVYSGASVVGVLTAAVNIEKLTILENIDIPYSGDFLCLIDKNNNIVEHSGSHPAEYRGLLRSFNFFSPLCSILTSDELKFIRQEVSRLTGHSVMHHKSTKDGKLISFASLRHSDEWKLVAVSSEKSIRSQQNRILIKIGALIFLNTLLIGVIAVCLYIINWKYRRIRELSHSTIDKAGFHFFKISDSGDVIDFEEDFASFLGIPKETASFNFKDISDDARNILPIGSIKDESAFRLSVRDKEKDRIFLLIQIVGKNEKGYYPAFAVDVTKDELAKEKIKDLAYTDPVTSLPNRESFILKIEALNDRCLSESFKSGLLFIDINNSHKILEIFGHKLYEKMLREATGRLSSAAAEAGGSIFNLGGDGFVLVIDDFEEIAEIRRIAYQINDRFLKPFTLGDGSFEVSCRVGIVSCPEYKRRTQITPSEMFRYGEITVRLAKANNDIFILDMESYLSVIKELDMEIDLISSIKNRELKIYYQPVYSYGPDSITAVESLLRWESKKYGKIPPSVFIPLAERSGFINQLGDFVIDTSLDFASKLHSRGRNILVNFNVSSMQFLQLSFAEKLIYRFKLHGLPKGSAGLEITESCLCENIEDLSEKLSLIRNEGMTVSIDDFGTGYSSLSYLKDLPIDYLKIDMSFINGIDRSEKQLRLFRGITDVARSLGVEVVAEGVETKDQLNAVLRCGCNNIQGFFIARPMNEKDTIAFINSFQGFRKE